MDTDMVIDSVTDRERDMNSDTEPFNVQNKNTFRSNLAGY
jgi:hypothetical protein